MAGDDEVVDQPVFGAPDLHGMFLAPPFLEPLERRDALARRTPLATPFAHDVETRAAGSNYDAGHSPDFVSSSLRR